MKPLFQLCSFLTSPFPLGLKGPFSENAPTPKDEQPGPANNNHTIQTNYHKHTHTQSEKCDLHSTIEQEAWTQGQSQLQQNSKTELSPHFDQQIRSQNIGGS